MVFRRLKLFYVFIILFLFESCCGQVENDRLQIYASPNSTMTRSQIENLIKKVRRDRYHVFENHSEDSLMIPGSLWRDTAGYIKYMDWAADTNGNKFTKVWILNRDSVFVGLQNDTTKTNFDSLLAIVLDSVTALLPDSIITGRGQENYYAMWNGTKSLEYNNLRFSNGRNILPNAALEGNLRIADFGDYYLDLISGTAFSTGFKFSHLDYMTLSILPDFIGMRGETRLQGMLAVGEDNLAVNTYYGSPGSIGAKSYSVYLGNGSWLGGKSIDMRQYIRDIRKNPSDPSKIQVRYEMIEFTGGILTNLWIDENWYEIP